MKKIIVPGNKVAGTLTGLPCPNCKVESFTVYEMDNKQRVLCARCGKEVNLNKAVIIKYEEK